MGPGTLGADHHDEPDSQSLAVVRKPEQIPGGDVLLLFEQDLATQVVEVGLNGVLVVQEGVGRLCANSLERLQGLVEAILIEN